MQISYKFGVAVDFDNTLVAYDRLFYDLAVRYGLVSDDVAVSKIAVRDAIRNRHRGELDWQALQAEVYGERINEAKPFPGAHAFIVHAIQRGLRVNIVSHKSPYAAARPAGPNLQEAARGWLEKHSFVGAGTVAPADVFFESSRAAKLARIRECGPAIVIDDLLEILTDPDFPAGARRWHFDPDGATHAAPVERFGSWNAMRAALDVACVAPRRQFSR